jgi:hypothetical protein
MTATQAKERHQDSDSRDQHPNLDDRYGRIGISAVAAAVRYQRETPISAPAHGKKPAHKDRD